MAGKFFSLISMVILVAAVPTIVGCGDSGLTLVPLTGTITLDGEPLPFKSLTLIPTDGTPGHGAGGYSDGQGNYKLRAMVPGAIKDFPGCPPGKYQVVVAEPQVPLSDADFTDAAKSAVSDSDEPAVAIALTDMRPKKPTKGAVPPIYSSNRTSPLVIEVVVGTDTANIALVSK